MQQFSVEQIQAARVYLDQFEGTDEALFLLQVMEGMEKETKPKKRKKPRKQPSNGGVDGGVDSSQRTKEEETRR